MVEASTLEHPRSTRLTDGTRAAVGSRFGKNAGDGTVVALSPRNAPIGRPDCIQVLHKVPTGERFRSADAGAYARFSTRDDGLAGGAGIRMGRSARGRVMSTIFAPRPIGSAGLARPLDGSSATGSTIA
jgi:hypothetical protein